ncbi:MAG: hypothetical protein ACRD0P_06585 [Stackebrandtia sp.]
MTTYDRPLRDSSRVSRLRATLGSRALMRAAVLAGLSGIAWLAGVAAAHADPIAGTASDDSTSSQLSSVAAPVVDPESAESEQAALTPANQLESDTSSILDVPGEVLGSASKSEAPQATSNAVTSADVTTTDTVDNAPSHRADGTPAVDSPETSVSPVLAPLAAAAEPVTGNLATVTEGVGGAVSGVSRPLKATAQPVDSLLTRPSQAPPPAMLTSLLAPLTNSAADPGSYRDKAFEVDNGVFTARAHTKMADDSVESVHGAASNTVSEGDANTVGGAHPRHADPAPSPLPVRPDFGITTSGAVPAGTSLYGPAPADSGVGNLASVHPDRNAEVSRVTPSTAVFGQLPDHVTDPAVSPD